MTSQFGHNGEGVRTSKTVAGDTTQYVLDLAATLPVAISDTEAVHLYGLDILAQQQAERYYYMHDGLGSVRDLVDSTGDVQANYAYDPFGVPMTEGEVYNPYQYTGEAWDVEVELLYLRARYYQPEVGRSITKDPWTGNASEPLTLNRYVYAADNPVNYADPSGQTRRPPYDVFAPYPYDISALELGWLWLTEQCPEYMVFDERWALTRQLMHDQGVNQARAQFYRRLEQGILGGRTNDIYPYAYVPIDYFREAAEYLAGYDRVGFFLGSYVVRTHLNRGNQSVTFRVSDPKNLATFTKSPCYYAPDKLGPMLNPHLPQSLQLRRSVHSLEGLVTRAQQPDVPSDVFLASLFEPRQRTDVGVLGTDLRFAGYIWLEFTWTEPLQAGAGR